jgi:hypothetical protein
MARNQRITTSGQPSPVAWRDRVPRIPGGRPAKGSSGPWAEMGSSWCGVCSRGKVTTWEKMLYSYITTILSLSLARRRPRYPLEVVEPHIATDDHVHVPVPGVLAGVLRKGGAGEAVAVP